MKQVVLNIVIAFLWVLFQDEDEFKFTTFFSGFLIGLIVIYILHRFFGEEFYLKKIWVAIKFLAVYIYQLLTSSISTINYILFKTKEMNPGLLTYETSLKRLGNYVLTILIIITPGSTVIRISKNTNKFFIHSIDVSEKDKQKLLKSIKQYEDLILEVTR